MNLPTRREREKADLKERILGAARTLLVEGGREAVTMREVARRVEYSPAALYQYFPDKESIIHELCITDFSLLASVLLALPQDGGPLALLCRTGFAYLQFARDYPEHYRFMFLTPTGGSPPDSPEQRADPATNAYVFLLGVVEVAMGEELLRPELSDPHLVTQSLWAAAHGVAALDVCRRSSEAWLDFRAFEERADAIIHMSILAFARDTALAQRIFRQVQKEQRGG